MSSPLFSLCGALFTIINSFITILHINDILISIFLQPPDLVTTLFDQGPVLLRLLFSLLHLNYHHHQWQQCRNLMSLACHLSSSSFVPFSLLFLLTTARTKHMIFSLLTEIFSLFAVFCRAITLNKHLELEYISIEPCPSPFLFVIPQTFRFRWGNFCWGCTCPNVQSKHLGEIWW